MHVCVFFMFNSLAKKHAASCKNSRLDYPLAFRETKTAVLLKDSWSLQCLQLDCLDGGFRGTEFALLNKYSIFHPDHPHHLTSYNLTYTNLQTDDCPSFYVQYFANNILVCAYLNIFFQLNS